MKLRRGKVLTLLALFSLATFPSAGHADALTRSTVDRIDDFSGFQIHFVYVVPQGAQDRQWDVNNQIGSWVNEAQTWLQKTVGHQLKIDTARGQVDVTFLQSKYSVSELCFTCDVLKKLSGELLTQAPDVFASKTIFFDLSEMIDPSFCGWAPYFSNLGVGFSSAPQCDNPRSTSLQGLSSPSKTIIHELFHTFGVSHVCIDGTDLMIGSPECTINFNTYGQVPITVDIPHQNYFGGESAGIDISQLPIWTDGSGSDSYARLTPTSGNKYIPQLTDGNVYAFAGETSDPFGWEWNRKIDVTFQNVSCTMIDAGKSISGRFVSSECIFDVPANWRVGSTFTVTEEIREGPFSGMASVSGTLVRGDYSSTPCIQGACFVGGYLELETRCWTPNTTKFVLQQIVDGLWQDVAKTDLGVDPKCGALFPLSGKVIRRYDSQGVFYYRWYLPNSDARFSKAFLPFAEIVVAADAPEPSNFDIGSANIEAEAAGEAADKAAADQAAADKAAADKAAVAKKRATITCVKGKLSKKVTAVKPVCPLGFKKKN